MKILLILLLLVVSEMALAFLFAAVSQIFYKRLGLDFRSVAKGVLERTFLVVALLLDYPHALTLFSALKLATRLKREGAEERGFNDYYLMGNLLSVLAAMGYVLLVRKLR
jgi:acyl-CoA thioesterase FadM